MVSVLHGRRGPLTSWLSDELVLNALPRTGFPFRRPKSPTTSSAVWRAGDLDLVPPERWGGASPDTVSISKLLVADVSMMWAVRNFTAAWREGVSEADFFASLRAW